MGEHEFTLVIEGALDDEVILGNLYEAGCSDATFGTVDALGYADFHREAPTFLDAVISALREIESVSGLRVRRIEPDDLVTMSEIAERLGRSRESIRLLASGQRGRGDFPSPVSRTRSRSRLWRWSEIIEWAGNGTQQDRYTARLVAALNGALELRNQRQELAKEEQNLLEAVAD
jgi:predicted DNA-binding transcriptional regulator AlpA